MHALARTTGQCGLWICAATLALMQPAVAEAPSPAVADARAAAAELGKTLQQALKEAMQSSGPEGAVEVCNLQALPITEDLSKALGMEIGRTAMKTRNPENRPDSWEEAQLEDFAARLAKGEPAATLEAVYENATGLRYMKAIPMQEPCATCHGTDVDPALNARIKALYPQDEATGFKVGDLRGAFTITIPRNGQP